MNVRLVPERAVIKIPITIDGHAIPQALEISLADFIAAMTRRREDALVSRATEA